MKKQAQLAPANDPLAGLGALPELGADPNAPVSPPMPTAAPTTPEKKYKGLSSPEDVFNDFNLSEALAEQYADEDLSMKIWQLYGGDSLGLNAIPGKAGEWPKTTQDNVSPEFVDGQFNATEEDSQRYKRLAEGYTIKDIFPSESEIARLISYTISTMQKANKQPQAQTCSWYRYAQNK
jgi:hypothetical protein